MTPEEFYTSTMDDLLGKRNELRRMEQNAFLPLLKSVFQKYTNNTGISDVTVYARSYIPWHGRRTQQFRILDPLAYPEKYPEGVLDFVPLERDLLLMRLVFFAFYEDTEWELEMRWDGKEVHMTKCHWTPERD